MSSTSVFQELPDPMDPFPTEHAMLTALAPLDNTAMNSRDVLMVSQE
jgi:hypothetical protein